MDNKINLQGYKLHLNNLRNKHLCKFFIFDIEEFYPSITENLLKKP